MQLAPNLSFLDLRIPTPVPPCKGMAAATCTVALLAVVATTVATIAALSASGYTARRRARPVSKHEHEQPSLASTSTRHDDESAGVTAGARASDGCAGDSHELPRYPLANQPLPTAEDEKLDIMEKTEPKRILPPLPSTYTNTSLHTLIRAQRIMEYENRARRAAENWARRELEGVIAAYWRGVRARRCDARRRAARRGRSLENSTVGRCAAGSARDGVREEGDWLGSEEDEVNDEERCEEEERAVLETKKAIARIRDRVKAHSSTIRPTVTGESTVSSLSTDSTSSSSTSSSPHPDVDSKWTYHARKLQTPKSTFISPSHLLSILHTTDNTISTVQEIDVAVRLWEGWDWDLDVEWELEVISKARFEGFSFLSTQSPARALRSGGLQGSSGLLGGTSGTVLLLPQLRMVTLATADVPPLVLLGMMGEMPLVWDVRLGRVDEKACAKM